MTKPQITTQLEEKHQALYTFLQNHDSKNWDRGPEGKWTTGQHIVHLIQSSRALNKGLSIPKLLLHYKFGTANREPRSYNEVVQKYQQKLASFDGPVLSPLSKNMPATPPSGKDDLIQQLDDQKAILIRKLHKLSDKALDKYLLPHPAMGRMILREIIMWTAYHTEHHHTVLINKYSDL